jgi:hypothetical protein
MAVPDPHSPKDWALLAIAQWGRSEEFPGHPFPGLVGYIELAVKGAVLQALDNAVRAAALADIQGMPGILAPRPDRAHDGGVVASCMLMAIEELKESLK